MKWKCAWMQWSWKTSSSPIDASKMEMLKRWKSIECKSWWHPMNDYGLRHVQCSYSTLIELIYTIWFIRWMHSYSIRCENFVVWCACVYAVIVSTTFFSIFFFAFWFFLFNRFFDNVKSAKSLSKFRKYFIPISRAPD